MTKSIDKTLYIYIQIKYASFKILECNFETNMHYV